MFIYRFSPYTSTIPNGKLPYHKLVMLFVKSWPSFGVDCNSFKGYKGTVTSESKGKKIMAQKMRQKSNILTLSRLLLIIISSLCDLDLSHIYTKLLQGWDCLTAKINVTFLSQMRF